MTSTNDTRSPRRPEGQTDDRLHLPEITVDGIDMRLGSIVDTRGGATLVNAKKSALAAFVGSTLEYYDFFIFGLSAALIFPTLFFHSSNPALATIMSLASFGAAYVVRPLGGLVLGHFGDTIGRKQVMVFTLVLMGASSLGIGLLATYDAIGVWAPALLLLLRLLQGFSAGGEAAGASTLTLEHSPEGRRGFFTSFAMAGFAAGMVIANLVFLPIAALPDAALFSWGWRIPFLASIVVIIVGYIVRRSLEEPEVFVEEREHQSEVVPVAQLFRTQASDVVRVVGMSIFNVFQALFAVWSLGYATTVGLERTTMLWVSVAANGLAIFSIPFWGWVSDRVGRRPVWIGAVLGCIPTFFFYLWSIQQASYPLVFLSGTLFAGLVYSGVNGLWPSFFTELFAPRVRYSGFAIGTQIGFMIGGFAPAVAAALLVDGVWGWIPVLVFAALCAVISAIAAFTARETAFTPLPDLGPVATRPRTHNEEHALQDA
ncbi:Predicted arabinose efflux permease, MFS family [Raineyella antarctica]|uniref:Predicted arabinose efflux permease, MFS family n=1 Tax=Raineyella antarctica TaxID=1577474 RepID=A0A1G6GF84_9ACTN|nr:MFS transporter [Raineyella antarctica]SDB79806.1 Predicted arabinose efflux permease, MFS family [Raineyella antarctica]